MQGTQAAAPACPGVSDRGRPSSLHGRTGSSTPTTSQYDRCTYTVTVLER
ncbi:MAG TPA: hypothetical protein VGE97_01480 [Nitrososphaera sp.]